MKSKINTELHSLDPSTLIELYQIDLKGKGMYYFHAGENGFAKEIVFNSQGYDFIPMEATGFEYKGDGRLPRPRMTISNHMGFISIKAVYFDDFIGHKVRRIKTFARFLDNINFPNNTNPFGSPDFDETFAIDEYYINQKTKEDKNLVEFELVSILELEGVNVPARRIMSDYCCWTYRSRRGCGYDGEPVADIYNKKIRQGGYTGNFIGEGSFLSAPDGDPTDGNINFDDIKEALDFAVPGVFGWYSSSWFFKTNETEISGTDFYMPNLNTKWIYFSGAFDGMWFFIESTGKDKLWFWTEGTLWNYASKDSFAGGNAFTWNNAASAAGSAGWIYWADPHLWPPNPYHARVYNYTDKAWYNIDLDATLAPPTPIPAGPAPPIPAAPSIGGADDFIRYPAGSPFAGMIEVLVWAPGEYYNRGRVVEISPFEANPFTKPPSLFVCLKDGTRSDPRNDSENWIKDECSKDLQGCRLRYGKEAPRDREGARGLPFGAFPGVSRYKFE